MFAVIFYVNLKIYQLLAQTDVDSMWTNMDLYGMVRTGVESVLVRTESMLVRTESVLVRAESVLVRAESVLVRADPCGTPGGG